VGTVDIWMVPVVGEDGSQHEVTVHAQRVLRSAPHERAVPASDQTPWIDAPDLRQSLRVWMPWTANQSLPVGVYHTDGTFDVAVRRDGVAVKTLPIRISLTVHDVETITLPPAYLSEGLSIPEGDSISSIYYLFEDSAMGPTSSQWWGDDTGNLVYVPVRDTVTGDSNTLVLRAHKVACGDWWGINTGQGADWGCVHQVQLQLEEGANTSLQSGQTYESSGSHPVIIHGYRWHDPNAGQLLGTLALRIRHTAP